MILNVEHVLGSILIVCMAAIVVDILVENKPCVSMLIGSTRICHRVARSLHLRSLNYFDLLRGELLKLVIHQAAVINKRVTWWLRRFWLYWWRFLVINAFVCSILALFDKHLHIYLGRRYWTTVILLISRKTSQNLLVRLFYNGDVLLLIAIITPF